MSFLSYERGVDNIHTYRKKMVIVLKAKQGESANNNDTSQDWYFTECGQEKSFSLADSNHIVIWKIKVRL